MANQPKKYKKFVATAATATLVASAIVPVASAASLSDIAGNTHEEAITALVDAKVISGYPDGTFKPGNKLTRSDVVKLLGKYLVSQGYEIPADAVSNPRFSDLKGNKELSEYAAVVADNGVFAGSNGKLLPADNITRENMAVVLVRMINTLKDVSLEEYVSEQNFKGDVKDLNAAKAEARSAISVLDFYDITNPSVANFNPKGDTTRGQFATFLYKTINTDFSGASAVTGTVKAINNTTVEVTYPTAVTDVKALKFTIAGLEVKNAVIKQTDAKTVVLTTSAQEAGKEYIVKESDVEQGKFTGVAAVTPTKVELVSTSVQGKLGQEVTVKAKVTVAEGQSAAGIPVTFNATSNNPTLNAAQVVEVTTDANGEATYTYTRYAAGNDTVVAYATGDRSKFATGYVFWGVDTIISVTDVTEGSTINNGANKNYKVKFTNPATGAPVANKRLLVSVAENLNVNVDKVQDVKVNGQYVRQYANGTAPVVAEIVTDSKGEATFTVSGTNANATPVVYEAAQYYSNGTISNNVYNASLLQAQGSTVKFAAIQAEYTIELTRDGGEEAATGVTNGRKYNVVVKDKDGNVAKYETVNVDFNEVLDRVLTTSTGAYFVVDGAKQSRIAIKTNAKGEASFVIGSDSPTDYATPLAWIDGSGLNAVDGSFDQGEAHTIGALTYFTAPKLSTGALTVYKGTAKATEFKGTETATFQLDLANQSGKAISLATAGYTSIDAEFTVFNDGPSNVLVDGVEVAPNRPYTTTRTGTTPVVNVTPKGDSTANVRVIVNGTAKDATGAKTPFVFSTKEVSAKFTSTATVVTEKTYTLASIDTDNEKLKFVGKEAISYADADIEKYYSSGNVEIDKDEFERQILAATGTGATITYKEDSEGKVSLKIAAVTSSLTSVANVSNNVYVTNVAITPTDKELNAGEVVEVTLTFSENVNIASGQTIDLGTETLTLVGSVANAKTAKFTGTLSTGKPNELAATLNLTGLTVTPNTGSKTFTTALIAAFNGDITKDLILTVSGAVAALPVTTTVVTDLNTFAAGLGTALSAPGVVLPTVSFNGNTITLDGSAATALTTVPGFPAGQEDGKFAVYKISAPAGFTPVKAAFTAADLTAGTNILDTAPSTDITMVQRLADATYNTGWVAETDGSYTKSLTIVYEDASNNQLTVTYKLISK